MTAATDRTAIDVVADRVAAQIRNDYAYEVVSFHDVVVVLQALEDLGIEFLDAP